MEPAEAQRQAVRRMAERRMPAPPGSSPAIDRLPSTGCDLLGAGDSVPAAGCLPLAAWGWSAARRG